MWHLVADTACDLYTLDGGEGTFDLTTIPFSIRIGGKEYIALAPQDDSGDVCIYGYEETGENGFELSEIEDDDEFEIASRTLDRLLAEENETEGKP